MDKWIWANGRGLAQFTALGPTEVIQTSHVLSRVGPLYLAMPKCKFPSLVGFNHDPSFFFLFAKIAQTKDVLVKSSFHMIFTV